MCIFGQEGNRRRVPLGTSGKKNPQKTAHWPHTCSDKLYFCAKADAWNSNKQLAAKRNLFRTNRGGGVGGSQEPARIQI